MKNKRGLARNQIMLWVIALLVLVIVIIWVYQLYPWTEKLLTKETCKQSVQMRSSEFMRVVKILRPSLQCQTEYPIIKKTNEQEIKRDVADLMFDCWDMLGAGRNDFLGIGSIAEALGGKHDCLICSKISFSDKLKKDAKELDLSNYLKENKITNTEITYHDFFTNQEGVIYPVDYEITKIRTDKDYAVVFLFTTDNDFCDSSGGIGACFRLRLLPYDAEHLGDCKVLHSIP